MADDSPGKVQALRAIFSEKSNPVMGLMPPPPATKAVVGGRPWRPPASEQQESHFALQEKKLNELRLGTRVLPTSSQVNGDCGDRQQPTKVKPAVGPKPSHLLPQRIVPDVSPQAKSKAFGETIASFMFASGNKENENVDACTVPPLPKPRIGQLQKLDPRTNLLNNEAGVERCSLISSDNYVCRVRRKDLPFEGDLGPAPPKPDRPAHMKLPSTGGPDRALSSAPVVQRPASLQRPSYPCPPRPNTSPPLPPTSVPVIKPVPASLREEIEELYEDTLLGENKRPVSLIPEFTEEEEAELYHDAAEYSEKNCTLSDSSLKYKKPPPPIPSEYLQPNINGSTEELYQDADGVTQEEFYEVMPCDEIAEESGSPLYSNNKREIEKLKKEEEKRVRREQKEKEKREKEYEKLRRKFGLTGKEIPIDDGLVKWDSRGGKGGDLPVKKGETVLILRMEGNPQGRWLVKNEKGKIGYVELTNIEVDPHSVKSASPVTEDNICTTPLEKNVTWLSKITACVR